MTGMNLTRYLPDLTRPKNEIYTILMFVVSAMNLIGQWLAGADLTTSDGVISAVVALAALVGRLNAYGVETVADIRAGRK